MLEGNLSKHTIRETKYRVEYKGHSYDDSWKHHYDYKDLNSARKMVSEFSGRWKESRIVEIELTQVFRVVV